MALPPLTRLRRRGTHRLVASRYPTAGILDQVASEDDLEAVFELEGWTNDRISAELGILPRLPRDEWVLGTPMASVVMAAFCHPRPGGGRFNDETRGAWYAAFTLETAHAEVVYHRTRELREIGATDARLEMREYRADFSGPFHDIREGRAFRAACDPADYTASQQLARELLAAGSSGLVYPSVRDPGGTCLACFRPARVANVRISAHYVFEWTDATGPTVTRLGT
jgi:RES domain-containing protein